MKEEKHSQNELLEELAALRRRVEELEAGLPSPGKFVADSTTAPLVHPAHQREGWLELSVHATDGTYDDYRSVVQSASEAICITQDGLLKFANHAGTELTGYSEEELLSMAFAALVHPEDLEELARIYMMRLRAEYVPPGHRFRIITKLGQVKWVESWSASITWQEGPAVLSMIRDVTGQVQEEERLRLAREELDRRVQETTEELQAVNERLILEARERKRAELSVRESEQMFRLLSEQSLMSIAILQDGVYKYANQSMSDLCEYSLEEILNWGPEDFLAVVHSADRTLVMQQARMKQMGDACQRINYEVRINTKSGIMKWVEIYSKTIQFRGNPANLITMLDVTERKKAEEALRESEEKYRNLLDNAPVGIFQTSSKGQVRYVNSYMARLVGAESAEEAATCFTQLSQQLYADPHRRDEFIKVLREEGKVTDFEYEAVRIDGTHRWFTMNARVGEHLSDGSFLIDGFTSDITERKQAEAALRESEQKYRLLAENISDFIWTTDLCLKVTYASPSVEKMYGWTTHEWLGLLLSDYLTQSSLDLVMKVLEEELAVQKAPGADPNRVSTLELEQFRKDGTTFWTEVSARFLLDNCGQPAGIIGSTRDISERKRAEEELRKSQDIISSILNSVPQSIFWKDQDSVYLGCNEVFAQAVGLDGRDQIVGKSDYDLPWPRNEADAYRSDDQDVMSSNQPKNHIIEPLQQANGNRLWIDTTKVPLVDQDGDVYGVLGVYHDITEQKTAQEALRERELQYRSIFDSVSDGLLIFDEDGRVVEANPAACAMHGYSREEMVGMNGLEFVHPDFHERFAEFCQTDPGAVFIEEPLDIRKDGTLLPLQVRGTTFKFRSKNHVLGVITDITDRKKAEEALRTSEAQLANALEMARLGHWELDVRKNEFTFNDQFYKLFRTTADQVGGYKMSLEDYARRFVHPDEVSVVSEENRKAIETDDPYFSRELEHRIVYADGNIGYISVRFFVVKDEQGRTVRTYGVNQDITQRKKAEEALAESEERFRRVFDQAPIGAAIVGLDGRLQRVNSEMSRITGYSERELVSTHFADITHPEYRTTDITGVEELVSGGIDLYEVDKLYIRKDGETVWARTSMRLVRDLAGNPLHLVSMVLDISERKRIEEALRKRVVALTQPLDDVKSIEFADLFNIEDIQRIQDTFSEATGVASIITEPDGTPLTQPSNFCRLCKDIIRNTPKGLANCFKSDSVIGRHNQSGPIVQPCLSGGLWDSGASITIGGKHLANWLIGQVRNEMLDEEVMLLYANEIGADPVEFKNALDEVPTMSLEQFEKVSRALFTFANELSVKAYQNVQQARSMNERERAEQSLKESERRYRTLFEESIDGVYSALRQGVITDANASFFKILGYTKEEMIGKNIEELFSDPTDRLRMQYEIEKEGFLKDYAVKFKTKDGKDLDCLITSSVYFGSDEGIAGYRGILRDVTDQQLLQRQLLQAQKMEAIGTLAGGIAHDVNNLLQAILGYSELLLMKKGPVDPDRKKLEVIQQAARDGADLVSRILTFSRKGESKTRPLDLNDAIRKSEELLRRTLPKMIQIELLLADDIAIINADPAQLEQVILNLGVNAQHAMPNGGRLLIETKNVTITDNYLRVHLGAKAGKYVLLTVSDTGFGIEADVMDRIFEPFFTTKTNGLGTGLGLAMVHGIVTQHGGFVKCYSEPGSGTTFKIYFPVSKNEFTFDPTLTREMPALGTETILLVDDDDRIREMAQQMMEMAGYKVIIAKTGEEALGAYSSHREEIALVILDIIMPGMGGKRCLEELLRINPEVRVLLASGYSPNGPGHDIRERGARGFVSKPYDSKDILTAIRRVLDEGQL